MRVHVSQNSSRPETAVDREGNHDDFGVGHAIKEDLKKFQGFWVVIKGVVGRNVGRRTPWNTETELTEKVNKRTYKLTN